MRRRGGARCCWGRSREPRCLAGLAPSRCVTERCPRPQAGRARASARRCRPARRHPDGTVGGPGSAAWQRARELLSASSMDTWLCVAVPPFLARLPPPPGPHGFPRAVSPRASSPPRRRRSVRRRLPTQKNDVIHGAQVVLPTLNCPSRARPRAPPPLGAGWTLGWTRGRVGAPLSGRRSHGAAATAVPAGVPRAAAREPPAAVPVPAASAGTTGAARVLLWRRATRRGRVPAARRSPRAGAVAANIATGRRAAAAAGVLHAARAAASGAAARLRAVRAARWRATAAGGARELPAAAHDGARRARAGLRRAGGPRPNDGELAAAARRRPGAGPGGRGTAWRPGPRAGRGGGGGGGGGGRERRELARVRRAAAQAQARRRGAAGRGGGQAQGADLQHSDRQGARHDQVRPGGPEGEPLRAAARKR